MNSNSDTWKQRKEQLCAMETLLTQGGFIEKCIMKMMSEMYSQEVIEVASLYVKPGMGVIDMADTIYEALNCVSKYKNSNNSDYDDFDNDDYFEFDDDEYDEAEVVIEDDFFEWFLDTAVKHKQSNISKDSTYFWEGWRLPGFARSTLELLSELEKRIVYLNQGLGNGIEMSDEEISVLPEFNCPSSYIAIIIERVEKLLGVTERSKRDFLKACEEHRAEKRKDLETAKVNL